MKLDEVTLPRETLLRNTIGRTMSAKGMSVMLKKLFNADFGIADTTPLVRPFNRALSSATDEIAAEQVWTRLYQELSHPVSRRNFRARR